MLVHLFRGPGRIFGFTRQPDGSNLPQRYAPWSPFKSLEINPGDSNPSFNTAECLDDLERYGLHLTDAHVRITETVL